jgi:hypothetical protein
MKRQSTRTLPAQDKTFSSVFRFFSLPMQEKLVHKNFTIASFPGY